jgi:hypothetical protein
MLQFGSGTDSGSAITFFGLVSTEKFRNVAGSSYLFLVPALFLHLGSG